MSSSTDFESSIHFDELMKAAREGDKESQGRLLEAYRRPLLRLARQQIDRRRLQAKGGGSDVVQDTLTKALDDIRTFQGCTPEQLHAWLRTILMHTAANFAREFTTDKRRVNRETTQVSESMANDLRHAEPSASEAAIRREQTGRLQRLLARLPAHYAEVIRLRFEEKLSFHEIASKMGGTAESARKLCSRAVAELTGAWS